MSCPTWILTRVKNPFSLREDEGLAAQWDSVFRRETKATVSRGSGLPEQEHLCHREDIFTMNQGSDAWVAEGAHK